MKRAWIDPVGGIAGDMLVAALIDAGADLGQVLDAVRGLGVPGWTARVERVWRGPFHASRFVVELDGGGAAPVAHAHDHAHREHGHDHAHGHASPAPGGWRASSRRWADIRALLEESSLGPRVRARCIAVFEKLAIAEGRVHGIEPEAVTFHEVGAVDSIVDVVAACVALELLGIDELLVGVLPLGSGHTLGDHGWIPLPAPATVELLRGFRVEGREVRGETVTPTGAALVAALARSGPLPAMAVERVGVGAGTWDPASHPNVVRVVVGAGEAGGVAEVAVLETNVDSLHPELVPPLLEALFDAGALDAFVAQGVMKKGRPGWLVTVLAPPELRGVVGEALLRHGRTLGYRWHLAAREVLARSWSTVETPWGAVEVKLGSRAGEVLHVAPEYDQCAAVARKAGVPTAEVAAAALARWWSDRG